MRVKPVLVYILLFLYVSVQIKPVVVIVEDVLAHTFWESRHMATIHYENGKYHVHAELKDLSEKENTSPSQKTPSSQKLNETLSAHIIQNGEFIFHSLCNPVHSSHAPYQEPVSGFFQITLLPPRNA